MSSPQRGNEKFRSEFCRNTIPYFGKPAKVRIILNNKVYLQKSFCCYIFVEKIKNKLWQIQMNLKW